MKKVISTIVGLVIVLGWASPASAVLPGQYCAHSALGTTRVASNGDTVKCMNKNGIRWITVGHPKTSAALWRIGEDKVCSYSRDLMMETTRTYLKQGRVFVETGSSSEIFKCTRGKWTYVEDIDSIYAGTTTHFDHFVTAYRNGFVDYSVGRTRFTYSCSKSSVRSIVWDSYAVGDSLSKVKRYYCHEKSVTTY